MRAAAVLVAAWCGTLASADLPPANLRVDFSQHGGDWTQGQCSSRAAQSPIDLNALFQIPDGAFTYFYNDVHSQNITLSNDGRVISIDVTGQGFGGLTLPNSDEHFFNLKRIDIHAMSEHTFRGQHTPIEIQLVHQSSTIRDPTFGPELITVSIMVDCENPPHKPRTWPGLLQSAARPRPAKKGHGPRSAAKAPESKKTGFLQQPAFDVQPRQNLFLDGVIPDMANDDGSSPYAEETREADVEMGFVRNLLAGERRATTITGTAPAPAPVAAPMGAPGPGPAPAGPAPYVVPQPNEKNFNPMFQFFVEQEPPQLEQSVDVFLPVASPLQLGHLLGRPSQSFLQKGAGSGSVDGQQGAEADAGIASHGGTYFIYRGSQTLPPCHDKVIWLIRRERVLVSDNQVLGMFNALYEMSLENGNFRTGMPVNNRGIDILRGIEREPVAAFRKTRTDFDDGRDSEYIPLAQDAITIAKHATDYARDLDMRIKRSQNANIEALSAGLTTPPPEPPTPPPVTIPAAPMDTIWAAGKIAQAVKKVVQEQIVKDMKEVGPAAAQLARSYLRQHMLARVGFQLPAGFAGGLPTQPPTYAPPTTTPPPTQTPCPHF